MSELRHIDWNLGVTMMRECRPWTPAPSPELGRPDLVAGFRREYGCEPPPWFDVSCSLVEEEEMHGPRGSLVLGSRWWQRLLGVHVWVENDPMVRQIWGFSSKGSVSVPVLPKIEAQWQE